jgi:homoserine dehydrogenase
VVGDAVGETMFYGRGAGELPTASAVVGDVVDIAMHAGAAEPMLLDYGQKKVLPAGRAVSQFFLRLSVLDRPGVLAAISSLFGKHKVSIKTVSQNDTVKGVAELVIITHNVQEQAFGLAMKGVAKLPAVKKVDSVIRVGLDEVKD